MLKFFIYTILFYIAARLILGKALGGGSVKTKVFRFDTHHHHYNSAPTDDKKEGSITVDKRVLKKEKNIDKNLGDYVDYEEVK